MARKIYNFEGPENQTVAEYLESLNDSLRASPARIVGEVVNLKLYEGRKYLYFSIKDKVKDAVLNCFMWKWDYKLSGIDIEDGLEVIIEGYPKIYEPNGSLSFQTSSIELVGEGALKKAYDKLKAKLEAEGVFAPERKRPIPEYPHRIGVITSRDGAVLSDFQSNIGHFGYSISFVNSKVEGHSAVKDLIAAVKTQRKQKLDVLVIMRGGGSLESFAAFNNEALVREIASFPVPVVAGIGHDKDICLVALAADKMVSTPTAVAQTLNATWEQALSKVRIYERDLVNSYAHALSRRRLLLVRSAGAIREGFRGFFEHFRESEMAFKLGAKKIGFALREKRAKLDSEAAEMAHGFGKMLGKVAHELELKEKQLVAMNPERQLKLGYSIVRSSGRIVKRAEEVRTGQTIDIQTGIGNIESKVTNINKKYYG